ncbi:MAG: hypothetical protein AB9834_01240 [Lentimicrobium sp.]
MAIFVLLICNYQYYFRYNVLMQKDMFKRTIQKVLVCVNLLVPVVFYLYLLEFEYIKIFLKPQSILMSLLVVPALILGFWIISLMHNKSMCKVETAWNYILPGSVIAFLPICKLFESDLNRDLLNGSYFWGNNQLLSLGVLIYLFINAIFAYHLNPLYRRWNGNPLPKCFWNGAEFNARMGKNYKVITVWDEGVIFEQTESHFTGKEYFQHKTDVSMKWSECEDFYCEMGGNPILK